MIYDDNRNAPRLGYQMQMELPSAHVVPSTPGSRTDGADGVKITPAIHELSEPSVLGRCPFFSLLGGQLLPRHRGEYNIKQKTLSLES